MMLKKYWFWIVGGISIVSIFSALFAEYILGLEPCVMCLKQRYPYYFLIFLFFIFLIFNLKKNIVFFIFVQLSVLYGLFYSLWHVGIEKKILPSSSECSGKLEITNSTESLKEQILSKSVVSCEDVVWSIFGLSAASINTIVLLLLFIFNALYLLNNYGKKKNINS